MRLLEIRKPLMAGDAVKELQQLLAKAGMKPGPIDGQFGPRTAAAVAQMRLRALAIIKGEVGTREQPMNSNVIKYTKWWGWGAVAYCVIGISWAWCKAGSTAFKRGVRWANTDVMLADAKAARYGLHLIEEPLPGSPGVIDFDGHSDPDHGITCVRVEGDEVVTAEFNTTEDGTSVEGVWEKRRALRECWWFAVEH